MSLKGVNRFILGFALAVSCSLTADALLHAEVIQIMPQTRTVIGPKAIQLMIKESVARARPATVNIKALREIAHGTFVQSIGSGILITDTGYILTNEHVVGDSKSIEVTLWRATATRYRGRIVGVDKLQDLALIRIKPRNGELFPVAKIDEQVRVRTGDRVIAIGNPFGLSHTVTSGIIGSTGRTLTIGGVVYKDLIQTDAPINQGNSGGALVNLRGEIIGINSAILTEGPNGGAFSGQGFAIPIDIAMMFASDFLGPK